MPEALPFPPSEMTWKIAEATPLEPFRCFASDTTYHLNSFHSTDRGNRKFRRGLGINDFNGDKKSDILWRNAVSGQIYIWLMDGTSISSQASPATISDLNWQIIGVGDFNRDGNADILWRNAASGQVYIWLMDGTSISSQASPATISDLNWQIVGVGDFNKDGKADILWRNADHWPGLYLVDGRNLYLLPGIPSDHQRLELADCRGGGLQWRR